MVWKHYPKARDEQIQNKITPQGRWWSNSIQDVEVQLKAETIQGLFPTFVMAYNNKKPLTFMLRNNIRYAMGKILNDNKEPQLLVEGYSDGLFTKYDRNKITSMATNTVKLYLLWSDVPPSLQRFILNKKQEVQCKL